jgi:RNA polymerase sigma-70 factor, ECF subfamily
LNEEKVYRRLREEDPAALEELMDEYWISVYQLIARILHGLGNSGDIEECCSDVFAAVWVKKEMFDPQRGSLRTWVLILARYRALDYRRRLSRNQKIVPGVLLTGDFSKVGADDAADGNPEACLLQKEVQAQMQRALESLPTAEREILYRRYFLEESVEHIASDLGVSRGAADNRLWRARQSLKAFFQREDKEVPIHG